MLQGNYKKIWHDHKDEPVRVQSSCILNLFAAVTELCPFLLRGRKPTLESSNVTVVLNPGSSVSVYLSSLGRGILPCPEHMITM